MKPTKIAEGTWGSRNRLKAEIVQRKIDSGDWS